MVVIVGLLLGAIVIGAALLEDAGWITRIINSLLDYIFSLFYLIFSGIALILRFCEALFKRLAGLEPIYFDGGESDNIIMAFITADAVWQTFIAVCVLSIVLLLIFTGIAIVKAEFSIDLKASAKAPIIGRALKAFAMFIIVPAIMVLGLLATNALTVTINQLMGSEQRHSLANQCFYAGASVGVRSLEDDEFVSYASGEYGLPSGGKAQADTINKLFREGKKSVTLKMPESELGITDAGFFKDTNTLLRASLFGSSGEATYSYTSFKAVRHFYRIARINWVVCIASVVMMSWTMLTVCFALVKRMFEVVMLFLLAPPIIALGPLDNGAGLKKWQSETLKRTLAIIGPIFAFNFYFIAVNLFDKMELFKNATNLAVSAVAPASVGATSVAMTSVGATSVAMTSGIGTIASGMGTISISILGSVEASDILVITFNAFFQLIVVLVGLTMMKDASALLATLLGIEDMIKSGGEMATKGINTAGKLFGTAAAAGTFAFKGVAAVAKGVKNVGSKVKAKQQFKKGGGDEKLDAVTAEETKAKEDEAVAQNFLDADAEEKAAKAEVNKYKNKGTDEQKAKAQAALVDAGIKKDEAQKAFRKQVKHEKGEKSLKKAEEIVNDKKSESIGKEKNLLLANKKGTTTKSFERNEAYEKAKADLKKAYEADYSSDSEKKEAIKKAETEAAYAEGRKKHGILGGLAGLGLSGKAALNRTKTSFANSSFGRAFSDEFAKDPEKRNSVLAGTVFDEGGNRLMRRFIDPLTGLAGGPESGLGMLIRRAAVKEDRNLFVKSSGYEGKLLENTRQQGLIESTRAASTEKREKEKEKKEQREEFKKFFKEQNSGLDEKALAEAFKTALQEFESGKGNNKKFEEWKKKSEQEAREGAAIKAADIKAENIEVEGLRGRIETKLTEKVKFDDESLKKMSAEIRRAMASGNMTRADAAKMSSFGSKGSPSEIVEALKALVDEIVKRK